MTDSEAIRKHQEEQKRELEKVRAEFVDDLGELISYAIASGVAPADLRADIDGLLSVQPGFEDKPGTCPGCGFDTDHDPADCPGLTAAQIRQAVNIVMSEDKFWCQNIVMSEDKFWCQSDVSNLDVYPDASWISPQTFGPVTGSVKRCETIGLEGTYVSVQVDQDEPVQTVIVKLP